MFKLIIPFLFAFPLCAAAASNLELEDFEAGVSAVKPLLSKYRGKKTVSDEDSEAIRMILQELVEYIPTSEQRAELLNLLLASGKLPVQIRMSVLETFGGLHVVNADVRKYILEDFKSSDEQLREIAVRAAGQVNAKDKVLQEAIVSILPKDASVLVKSAALEAISIRTESARKVLKDLATGTDRYFKDLAQQKLDEWASQPERAEMNQSMAAIGDSISVGLFSDTYLPDAAKYTVTPKELNVFWLLGHSSHTEGLNLSWATGIKGDSHLGRLKENLKSQGKPNDVEEYNLAVSGAKTSNLFGQIAELYGRMALKPSQNLLYVTMFMGSNDLCDGIEHQKIARNLRRALKRLNRLQDKRPLTVLVPAMLPIYELSSPAIANYPGLAGLTCQQVQTDHLKFCNRYIGAKTQAEVEANKATVASTNEEIERVVKDATELKNLNVVLGKSLKSGRVQPEMMAFDCFHPNHYGQMAISELLWNDLMRAGVNW